MLNKIFFVLPPSLLYESNLLLLIWKDAHLSIFKWLLIVQHNNELSVFTEFSNKLLDKSYYILYFDIGKSY